MAGPRRERPGFVTDDLDEPADGLRPGEQRRPLDGPVRQPGRSTPLAPGTAATILDLEGADAESRGIVATLTVEPFNEGQTPLADTPDVVALCKWGNGGVQAECEIDYCNGTVIAVHASSLRITAQNRSPSTDRPLLCGAFAGYGPRSGHVASWARRTLRTGKILPAAFLDLAVPAFAATVDLLYVPTTAVITALFLTRSGAVEYARTAPAGEAILFTPIGNRIRTLRIINAGAVDLDNLDAVFHLTL